MMKRIYKAVTLITVLALFPALISSQVATGTPPFNSFGGGPFDVLNLGNVNVHFAIPILHKAGRGMPFAYDLIYDSSIWTPVGTSGNQTWQAANAWGWQSTMATTHAYVSYTVTTSTGNCGPFGQSSYTESDYSNFVFHDEFGVKHPASASQAYISSTAPAGCPPNGPQPSTPMTVGISDGSGYTLYLDPPGQYSTSGHMISRGGATINVPFFAGSPSGTFNPIDANGNQITLNSSTGVFTDTLGQGVLTVSGSNPVQLTYTPASGTNVSFTVNYGTYNIRTNFGCSGVAEYTASNVALVNSIGLPDGSSYSFSYEATQGFSGNVTGRLTQVTLPTGGTISYSYPLTNNGTTNGINCADGSAPAASGTNPSLTRTLSGGQWTYARTNVSGSHWQTKITSPAGDNTVIDFQQDGTTGTAATHSFYETQRQVYQGNISSTPCSSTVTTNCLVETVVKCYNGNLTLTTCATTTVTLPITEVNVYPSFPSGRSSRHDNFFDQTYGRLTEVDDYDWSTATPPLMRKTIISYATLGNNIVDRPASVTVQDGAGNVKAQTNYTYDEAAYCCTTSSGTPQHIAISGSRGNVTTISSLVAGTTYLTKHISYFDTGTPNQLTDVNGAITTVNYPDATSTCGNAFPTSVTPPAPNGVDLTSYTTWNCNGGVATSTRDANGATNSVTAWDPYFGRPTATSDPTGFTFNTNYGSPNAGWSPPMNQSNWSDTYAQFNNNNAMLDKITKVDGLGRVHLTQRRQGPPQSVFTFDSVQTNYDSLGRLYQVSMPYAAGFFQEAPAGTPFTTTSYDALGRPTQVTAADGVGITKYTYNNNDVLIETRPAPTGENTKQRQYEYDALGRLTSVCEVVTDTQHLTGSGPCGQINPLNGYLTNYTYDALGHLLTVTQNAQAATGSQQTRTFTYDKLGRMTSEANPETGTVNYAYETGSFCGAGVTGDLAQRQDASLAYTCYGHDALHRLTGVGHYTSGGSFISGNGFIFDVASVNGISVQNPKGRLAGAYDCNAPCSSHLTDTIFSYSARGETTDTWEQTAHSGGYYHLTQTYWESGAAKQLSGLPGLPAITYGGTIGATVGLDGEGRFTQVTAATGQNPVTGATYYNSGSAQPIGALTDVVFGSSDTDHFDFDINTGRLTKYTFNVGNPVQTDIGTLTWNANGSLKQLAIADIVPGAIDTQTCNYTHDDLGRIASVDCGSAIWQQNFSYDPFGNITKTVPTGATGVSFQPTYTNPPTNRISSAGYSYDSNGNLTADATGSHSYRWDAEGNPICIDGVAQTYDAMGRLVEQARGGSSDCSTLGTNYQQIVYGPGGGKLALMSAQNLTKAFVALPGGATAVYTSTGLAYYRHSDRLGSSRMATTPLRAPYYTGAYAPFGENYKENGTTDRSFTVENQDTAGGAAPLYDFMFREQTANQGRWISPDPAGLAAVSMTNPQSWNRYGYVGNRPLNFIDPLGLLASPCWPNCGGDDDGGGGDGGGGNGGGGGPGFGRGFIQPLHEDGQIPGLRDNPNPIVPAPPCDQAANAPDPSVYEAKGLAAQNNAVIDLYYLPQFMRGGKLDAQVLYGGSPAYANYAYGVYMSAAGYTLDQALSGADFIAQHRSYYRPGTVMNPKYQFTPEVNVMNITYGFNAQQNGTLCHK